MKKNKCLLLFVSLSICFLSSSAQQTTLSLKELISIITLYHPIVKQSDARIQQALAGIQISRGGFDPELQTYYGQKELGSTTYYNRFQTELNIPTWYGISIKSGVEAQRGDRLDVSETSGTLQYLGMEIPLAKNLLYDKRRYALQQSKLVYNMSYQEQQNLVNDLLMAAVEKYWQWVKFDQLLDVINQNIQNTRKRFEWTKQSYQFGDRAAIDTLEAFAQLQAMEVNLLQYSQQLVISRNELSVYLWDGTGKPYSLPDSIRPMKGWETETQQLFPVSDLSQWLEKVDTHPLLLMSKQKLSILQNDKRIKFQELLPKVNLQYNVLQKSNSTSSTIPFQNNYQYGLKFQMPLRLSEGRGSYKQAKLKLLEGNWEVERKQREIEVKIRSYYNEYMYFKQQTQIMENNYSNYLKLVDAEEKRLELGESSLFMVNSRESKLIEVMEKWLDMKTKLQKSICALGWSAGILKSGW